MMPDDYRREHAVSFARAAEAYERGRPPYPAAAIDWLLPDGAQRVLDLGAGTGKLTRLLAARGLAVTAVEPLAEMREQLHLAVPGVPALAGTAERIPLPDASFDAVLVDIDHSPRNLLHPRHAALYQPAGLARLAEHLRPGGVFALWSNDPPDDEFGSVLAGVFATSAAHVVTFDNPLQHRDASNTVYIGVKADRPVTKATIEAAPSAD